MSNKYWLFQEKKLLKTIEIVKIPNSHLKRVDSMNVTRVDDLKRIPSGGGCYWIWTNEPVKHSLHKHKTPRKFNSGEIIYNGIAKDDVRGRIGYHLFAPIDATWSGISLDIFQKRSRSHRKKACSPKGKVPYLNEQPIRKKSQLMQLHLSSSEISYIKRSNEAIFYFKNGIDITNPKHHRYEFRVYFITGLSNLYLGYIEKKWRKYGLPKLCSYSEGR